jgi:hypothetical protein
VGRTVARNARPSREMEPVQGSGSQPGLHAGFAVVHHKTVGLLRRATKPSLEVRRAEKGFGPAEKLRCRGTRDGIVGLASGGRRLR